MTVTIQLMVRPSEADDWVHHIGQALDARGIDARLGTSFDPATVDYVVYAPSGPVDLAPYARTKAVLGLWAGVESIITNQTLTQPYARMVDPGMTQGMVEYVTGNVLRHHLGLDRYIRRTAPDWVQEAPPLARDRRVSVLGLGELGAACARALAALGFDVAGWSRSPKSIEGVTTFAGEDALDEVLARSDILVLLVPLTASTQDLLNADRLARLPQGAVIVNPGRGRLIDEDALLRALDEERLGHATLDTFRVEPLPEDHRFWTHPRVTVTPHIASETRHDTASEVVAENIGRVEAGLPLLHEVDRTRGY